jgi:4-hydroxy-tetrahydrodipicolinate synthase
MQNANFRGTGVALVTPFTQDKKIDFDALEKLINHVIQGGVNYLVSLGTTGETPTLSSAEKLEVLNFTITINNNRLPIVAGIGGNNTSEVLETLKLYPLDKIQGILSVMPYYNKPSQEGIFQHFSAIANACTIPIILYNVPGRTGGNMNAETVIRLANTFENIVAIKEASGNLYQNMAIVAGAPKQFMVLSGDDDLVLSQIAIGLQGVISVAANCFTKDFTSMVNFALENKYTEARELHYKLLPAIGLLFTDGNPPGVKYVLHKMGICHNEMRLPVVPVSENVATKIDAFLATI